MTTYTFNFPNMSNGVDEALVDLSTELPSIVPGILFFVFFIVLIGGSSAQHRRMGTADYPLWATWAGVSTTLVAMMMSLKYGIINLVILSTVVSITILSAFWLFVTRNRNEP